MYRLQLSIFACKYVLEGISCVTQNYLRDDSKNVIRVCRAFTIQENQCKRRLRDSVLAVVLLWVKDFPPRRRKDMLRALVPAPLDNFASVGLQSKPINKCHG